MPLIARNLDVHTSDLLSAAFDDAIEPDVVLKRVGTNDVIVVAIKKTNGNAAGLIDASRDRFELYRNVNVLGDEWFKNGQRKPIVCSVRAGLFDRTTSK